MDNKKLQDDVVLDISRETKNRVGIVHLVVTIILLLALLCVFIVWIWEEVAKPEMYYPEYFLDDPKFRQARAVLMLGYGVALLLILVLEFCLQIEVADEKESTSTGKRIIWSITAGLLFFVFVGSSLLALFYRINNLNELEAKMQEAIGEGYLNQTSGGYSDTGKDLNRVQGALGCCGVDSYSDYGSVFANETELEFPYSCCELKSSSKGSADIIVDDVKDWVQCQAKNAEYFNSDGCYSRLYADTRYMCTETAVIGFVAAALLLIGMILRLATETHFDKRHEKYLKDLERRYLAHTKLKSSEGKRSISPEKENGWVGQSKDNLQDLVGAEGFMDEEAELEKAEVKVENIEGAEG